ncbi:hypothetical protein ACJRO7_032450 [Eucalyptus globulus]|uniref:Uncharacterized protein n=1 Tax=Eucalyptus globulus TaxID=34317 RepID=A0ABD3JW56_EUCGL
MAPHANRLADIGREGFAIVDRFYGEGTSGPVPKKQYKVPKQYASVPSDKNAIDSKKAAEKYKGTVVTKYYKKFIGWRF